MVPDATEHAVNPVGKGWLLQSAAQARLGIVWRLAQPFLDVARHDLGGYSIAVMQRR